MPFLQVRRIANGLIVALALVVVTLTAQAPTGLGQSPVISSGGTGGFVTAGGVFAGPGYFPDGTAPLPSIAFASEPTLGFWRSAAGTINDTGNLAVTGSITSGSDISALATGMINWAGRTRMRSSTNGAWTITPAASTTGVELTMGGLPTVTACGTGTVNAKSTNSYGGIVPTGASACTVVFHVTPPFTNTPFCQVTLQGTAEVYRISAISTTSFTVTYTTAGNPFMYSCGGGV